MSAHITLRSEPGSAHFPERSIELQEGASVRVSRLSRDERPNYNNVIFDSRVRRIFEIFPDHLHNFGNRMFCVLNTLVQNFIIKSVIFYTQAATKMSKVN